MTNEPLAGGDPVEADEPPYFPFADPDAPVRPDWDNVAPEGEQFPDAGDPELTPDELDDEIEGEQ